MSPKEIEYIWNAAGFFVAILLSLIGISVFLIPILGLIWNLVSQVLGGLAILLILFVMAKGPIGTGQSKHYGIN